MLYKGQSTHGSFTLAEHLPKPFQCKLSAASDLRGREYYEQDDTSTVISASKVNVPTKPLCQTCAVNKWCRTSITHKIRTSVRFRVWNNTTEECFCKDTVLKISLQRCHLHAPHKARSSAIKLHPADEREAACQLVFRRPILGRSFLSINEILPRNYDYKLQKKREEEEALRTFMWTNLFLEASVLSVSGPVFCFIFYFNAFSFKSILIYVYIWIYRGRWFSSPLCLSLSLCGAPTNFSTWELSPSDLARARLSPLPSTPRADEKGWLAWAEHEHTRRVEKRVSCVSVTSPSPRRRGL